MKGGGSLGAGPGNPGSGGGDAGSPGSDEEEQPQRRLAGRRSQLVLVAAGVAAVGLLPIVVAYTQLGYTGVAGSDPAATTPTDDVLDALERAAFEASVDSQARSPWSERERVASDVGRLFDERAAAIESAGVDRERAHAIDRNASRAAAVASEACPGGPNRQFGPCDAIQGVVVQERGGETHVIAIAVDVRTVVADGTFDGTYVLDAGLGNRR